MAQSILTDREKYYELAGEDVTSQSQPARTPGLDPLTELSLSLSLSLSCSENKVEESYCSREFEHKPPALNILLQR